MLLNKRIDTILSNDLAMNETLEKIHLHPEHFRIVLNKNKPLGVYWSKHFLAEHPDFLDSFTALIPQCIEKQNALPICPPSHTVEGNLER